ncbi:MAG: acetyl-CoA carboxylase biotin carboxyl carrier protein subunit [bacterium]
MAEKYLVRDGDNETAYELDRDESGIRVRQVGSEAWKAVELQQVGETQLYLLMIDSHPVELFLQRRRGGAHATIGRHAFDYDVERWRAQAEGSHGRKEATGPRKVVAPMTGSIVEVRCAPGDVVQAGDVLLVIESMKMNNELRSPAAGTVEQVPVAAGQRVTAGQLLVALELTPTT